MKVVHRNLILFILLILNAALTMASTIDFVLLGVISSSKKKNSIVLVKDQNNGRLMMKKVGQKINPETKIIAINQRNITVEMQGAQYLLRIGGQSIDPERLQANIAANDYQGSTAPISEGMLLQNNVLYVEESLKRNIIENGLAKVLMQAATEPHIVEGQVQGFSIWDIEPDSIYEQAGFINSDIITHINGTALDGASTAIKMLNQLRKVQDADITFMRHGIEKQIKIVIR